MILLSNLLSSRSSFRENRARERRISANVQYLRSFDNRMLADIGLTRPEIEGFVRNRMGPSSGADVSGIIEARFKDAKWWYWLATAILLFEYLVGGSGLAMSAAIGLTTVQLFHFAAREGTLTAFPVQVRAAYVGLLVIGLLPWMNFLHWVQLFGTSAMVL